MCLGAKKRRFATFYFFRLNLHVKNKLKLLKNRQFSILDKSADMADINDRQVLWGVFRLFWPESSILVEKSHFSPKIAFFGVRCPKMAFSHKWKNQFFAEISAKLEYSRKTFSQKKLVTLPDTPHKYHVNRAITLEDIQKWSSHIFIFASQYGHYFFVLYLQKVTKNATF